MQKQQPRALWLRWLGALFIIAMLVAACNTEGTITTEEHDAGSEHNESESHDEGSDEHEGEGEHDGGESHDEQSDEHEAVHEDLGRIPNEGGAAIHIISPQEGDVITGSEVIVEVEVENFELDDGSHWHVYVDGVSHGMVLGHDFDQALRGLEPGEHTIEVHLALGTHEELEDGSTVTVTVSE